MANLPPIQTAAEAIRVLTPEAIAAGVGVDVRTVTNKSSGRFPSYWFPDVQSVAFNAGRTISASAFNFRRNNSKAAS